MTDTSADLWIEPTAPLGDAAEVSGPFGGVCGPVVADAKKKCNRIPGFFQIHFLVSQLPEAAHVLVESERYSIVLQVYFADISP